MSPRWKLVVLVAALLVIAGCAGPNPFEGTAGRHGVAGFWSGLWHGATCIFTLVASFFSSSIRIYEVHNSGVGYNIGFVLGTAWLFAAGHGSSRD
jgi:hypothetical protein